MKGRSRRGSRVKAIIRANRYMTLATADRSAKPWISPLFFAEEKGIFYWYSPKRSRHSRYIATNPRVAITIFNSTSPPSLVYGAYFEAYARELDQAVEVRVALAVLAQKSYRSPGNRRAMRSSVNDFVGSSPLRVYAAKTKNAWVLGPVKKYRAHYLDSRVKVD
ncbi:MAG: pyridoxamine 5'-phosphate oxidase family protein [bacterium]|nr:pyridoxamine 5'-phosphate oxidase family protein [bacterium]